MPMRLRSELPDFAGATEWVNGQLEKEDLQGKPVLIHFWAVSCHMCKESLPQINEWRETYGKEYDLQLVGVHMPRSQKDTEIDPVKETIQKFELQHPIVIDNQHKITDKFQNEYVPAYYLFDENMQLRHFQAGEKGLQMVQQRLQKILGVPKEGES